jgi:hypothetical protein
MKKADGLHLLILVGACGAFVAALPDHERSSSLAPIVNLRSPRRSRSRRADGDPPRQTGNKHHSDLVGDVGIFGGED